MPSKTVAPPNPNELIASNSFLGRILTPGSTLTPKFRAILNLVFIGVALSASLLFFAWGVNIHTMVFSFLLLGLVISTNWFFSLLDTAQKASLEEAAQAKSKDKASTPSKSTPATDAVAPSTDAKVQRRKGKRDE